MYGKQVKADEDKAVVEKAKHDFPSQYVVLCSELIKIVILDRLNLRTADLLRLAVFASIEKQANPEV